MILGHPESTNVIITEVLEGERERRSKPQRQVTMDAEVKLRLMPEGKGLEPAKAENSRPVRGSEQVLL